MDSLSSGHYTQEGIYKDIQYNFYFSTNGFQTSEQNRRMKYKELKYMEVSFEDLKNNLFP